MKAVSYESFGGTAGMRNVADSDPVCDGVVIEVKPTGLCRSDWHGWIGNYPDIVLSHAPGRELAGIVAAVGPDVARWNVGDCVTVPFVGGCGECFECRTGDHQVCESQFQPGFTHWGSFAEFVAIHTDLSN